MYVDFFGAGQRPRIFIFAAHREQVADLHQRIEQGASLYSTFREGIRTADAQHEEASLDIL
jgi:hypothetical protein